MGRASFFCFISDRKRCGLGAKETTKQDVKKEAEDLTVRPILYIMLVFRFYFHNLCAIGEQ